MSGLLSETVDPLETAVSVIERYERLWEGFVIEGARLSLT